MRTEEPDGRSADPPVGRARRWAARGALAAAAAAVLLPLLVAGVRVALGILLVGLAGLVASLAGVWWFLTRRGVLRWLAAALAVLGPVAVVVAFARAGVLWVALAVAALWVVAVVAAGAALARPGEPGPAEFPAPPVHRPVLLMNPRSGGGKVGRFGLVDAARARGATVILLEGGADAAELARRAVAEGADLLGVAGGDGTQALVAGVAAEQAVPFLVISAGTRNHFARDLGLDLEDPARCLDALDDGVELRVDLGEVGGRVFVNNASFGAYATVVRSPEYRDAKVRTTLDLLPDSLAPQAPALDVVVDGRPIPAPQAVLVSNNPYDWADPTHPGYRPRLDGGVLGVLAVRVEGARGAVALARGPGSRSMARTTAAEVDVGTDGPVLDAGVDGEAIALRPPVRCCIRPGALRVLVPRQRPGARPARPALDWTTLRDLARPARRPR